MPGPSASNLERSRLFMEKELENMCVEKSENYTWQTVNPDATKEKFSCYSGKSDVKCKKKKTTKKKLVGQSVA